MSTEPFRTFSISHPEYVVYSFNSFDPDSNKTPTWQRILSVPDEGQALEKARSLFGQASCRRVEIRKRFYDPARGITRDEPVTILRHDAQLLVWKKMLLPAVLALGCAGFALFLTLHGA